MFVYVFFALTCGSLFFLHRSAKIENAICSLNTSGGPEKTFRWKISIDERGRPSNKIPFKEAFKQLPKITIAVLLPHFFVDPTKKRPCFFGSSRVVVWFFVVLFFLAVFDSTKFPHGWKQQKQPPENLGGRCASRQVCFLWRAPIANTNTWTELPGGFQKNPRFSAAAA